MPTGLGWTGPATARVTLAWAPQLLGGDLLLQAVTEAGRRNSGLIRWSRTFDGGPAEPEAETPADGGAAVAAAPGAMVIVVGSPEGSVTII